MDKKLRSDAEFKTHVDLWIHCNNLIWERLRPLALIQAAFFALAAYLIQQGENKDIIWIALVLLFHCILCWPRSHSTTGQIAKGNQSEIAGHFARTRTIADTS
jgi:hypothetical protein